MGLLDSIFKSVKREVEHDVARNAANVVASSVTNVFNNTVNKAASNSNSGVSNNGAPSNERYQGFVVPNNTQNGGYQPSNPTYEPDGTVIIDGIDYSQNYNCDLNHFRTILKESFPDMTLNENVPLKDIIPGIKGAYNPISFLLSDGVIPKIAIQIRYPGQNTCTAAKRHCQQHSIGYISLWTNYKNQKEYIEKRVKDCLWN